MPFVVSAAKGAKFPIILLEQRYSAALHNVLLSLNNTEAEVRACAQKFSRYCRKERPTMTPEVPL